MAKKFEAIFLENIRQNRQKSLPIPYNYNFTVIAKIVPVYNNVIFFFYTNQQNLTNYSTSVTLSSH